jgi:NADH dehydrogenase
VLKEMHLEPGDTLFHAGEPAFSLYLVQSGTVELSDDKGVVGTQRRGDYFGERALLTDGQWMFTARATEPTQLVSIPAPVFRQIVGHGGSLGRFFEKSARRYQARSVIDALVRQVPAAVLDQPVSALMQTELTTLRPEQTVASAIATIRDDPHSSYPLIHDGGGYAGLLLREDFQDFLRQSPRAATQPLSSVGSATGPTVTADTPVREAIERLVRSGANKLLVLDEAQHVRGIVTVMDFAAAAAREQRGSERIQQQP